MAITQTCRITGKQFIVTEREQQVLAQMRVPLPTICIEERLRRRLARRNERTIYKRVCSMTGKPIISIYPPDSPFTVYSQDAWWSDKWDPRQYGQDFDFNRPFFEQFNELQSKVPRIALLNTKAENSEYCNVTTNNKNCYLVFGGDFNEDCMYCGFNFYCRDTLDCYWVTRCELCYQCVNCSSCYNTKFSQDCQNCRDSQFLFECKSCENCTACVGLRNKKYHIANKPYSKEEYQAQILNFGLDKQSGIARMKELFNAMKLELPHKYADVVNCEFSNGDHMLNCKNCENCFDTTNGEDCKDLFLAVDIKDSFSSDHVGHGGAQLYYEMLGSIEGHNCAFCSFSWTSQNTFYCDMVVNSHDLFGCTNMKRAEYCILNKQYTKEQYEELVPRIIEHMKKPLDKLGAEWGEFFPIAISPFGYNETIANEYFPLTKKQALAAGYKWRDQESKDYQPQTYAAPDSILKVQEDVLDAVLVCSVCSKNFKIIPKELKFLKQLDMPLPDACHECRHKGRLTLRNPPTLFDRKCSKCGTEMKSTYAPERPETVYCEKCYFESIY